MAMSIPVTLVDQTGAYVTAGGAGGGTLNTNLTQIGGANIALGNTTSANSLPVTIASDQSLAITGSVTASGTVTLGAGSASVGTVILGAGSAIAGKFGIDQTTPGTTNGVQLVPGTAGGYAVSTTIISSTTATVVKGSAGQIYHVSLDNNSAGPYYCKIYNATTATVGTGTPALRLMCPGPTNGGGGIREVSLMNGLAMGTGIAMICTLLQADADTSAVPAGVATVNIFWK